MKQRLFCVAGGQGYNPSSSKTQAGHVGPVNVICNVLITSWRLGEAVCVLGVSGVSRRPDLLSSSRGDGPGNEIFSLCWGSRLNGPL